MRHNQMEARWEQARDGELSAQEQREFEAELARAPQLQDLWLREGQWLEALREPMSIELLGDQDRFVASVRRSQALRQSRDRRRRRTLGVASAWVAAAAVMAMAIWLASPHPSSPQDQVDRDFDASLGLFESAEEEPLSVFVLGLHRVMDQQRRELQSTMHHAQYQMQSQSILKGLGLALPDPIMFVDMVATAEYRDGSASRYYSGRMHGDSGRSNFFENRGER